MTTIKLHAHRNTRERRERHRTSENLVSAAKEAARGKSLDGWALVKFRRDGDGLAVSANYSVTDARDANMLPDLARNHLLRLLIED